MFMKNHFLLAGFGAAALLLMNACQKPQIEPPVLTLETTELLNEPATAHDVTVPFSVTNGTEGTLPDVTPAADYDWADVKDVTASAIVISLDENGPESPRTAEFTVSYAGAEKGASLKITQEAGEAPAEIPVISLDPASAEVPADGVENASFTYSITNPVKDGTLSVAVSEEAGSYVSATVATDGSNVNYTVKANEGEAREAVITVSYSGAEDASFKITQEAGVAPSIVLQEGSDAFSITAEGNDPYDESDVLTIYYKIENGPLGAKPSVASDVSWITITSTFQSFTDFQVARNNGDEPREGHITLSLEGAVDETVTVTQEALGKPSITITSEQPYPIGRKGCADPEYVRFTVENLRDGETVEAVPDVDWLTITFIGSGYLGFTASENTGDERTGNIRLSYRDAEPVDFVVTQAGVPEVWGEGLEVSVTDITSNSVTVNVSTFINETYAVGVAPKSDIDSYGDDKAFVDALVREMLNEYEYYGSMYGTSFARYFSLTNDDSSTSFGTDEYDQKMLSDTDYYAFAFDITADEQNRVTYSGTLYKTEFRTLPAEQQEEMTFTFSFNEDENLVCTPSDLTRPYCMVVLDHYAYGDMTPEEAVERYQNLIGEYFTGVGVSKTWLGEYSSPYRAYAFGYDQALGERTSSITVYEFAYPPEETAASSVILNRSR